MEGPEYKFDSRLLESDTSVDADPKRTKALEMLNDLVANYSDVTFGVEEGALFADQRAYWKEKHDIELTESVRLIQVEMAVNTCLHALLQIRKGIESGAEFVGLVADVESKKVDLEKQMQAIIDNPSSARNLANAFQLYHPDAFEFLARGYADMSSHLREIAGGVGEDADKRKLALEYVVQKFSTLQNIKAAIKSGMEALDENLLAYSSDVIAENSWEKDTPPSQN